MAPATNGKVATATKTTDKEVLAQIAAGITEALPPEPGLTPVIVEYDSFKRNLIAALIRAKPNFLPVFKTTVGARGKFAPLHEVLEATDPFLLQEGIFMTSIFVEENEQQYIDTMLFHVSGEFFLSRLRFDMNPDWQKVGTAMSYARRYSILAILCLAAYDDDGESSAGALPPSNSKTQALTSQKSSSSFSSSPPTGKPPGKAPTIGKPPGKAPTQATHKKIAPKAPSEAALNGYISVEKQTDLVVAMQETGFTPEARRLLLKTNGGYLHPKEIPDTEEWIKLYQWAQDPAVAEEYNLATHPPVVRPEDDEPMDEDDVPMYLDSLEDPLEDEET